MSVQISLQQTATGSAVAAKRTEFAGLRAEIARVNSEVAGIRTTLRLFEDRYFREVGALYAELDRLHAEIAEREADLYDSEAARERASEARKQADASREAAEGELPLEENFDPPANLKKLFRDVARRIHPDLARDEEEAGYLTLRMARANQAYRSGDIHTLQQMLDDDRELAEYSTQGEEADRLQRQIVHARRDLSLLESERHTLMASEIARMHADAEAARAAGHDMLADLAVSLREQVARAREQAIFVDKQVTAHGR